MTTDDVLPENGRRCRPGPRPEKFNAATEWLRAELADMQEHPVLVLKALAKDAGLNWCNVERASHRLKISSKKSGFGGGYVWRLPATAEA
jgi:hypothetical protein